MTEIKLNLCKEFIKMVFEKHCIPGGGIETNCFFKMAAEVGLYIPDTYGTPISKALEELTTVETVSDDNGNYKYTVFRLK